MLVGQYQINFLDLDPAMTSVIQCNASNKHGHIYKNAVLNVLCKFLLLYYSICRDIIQ